MNRALPLHAGCALLLCLASACPKDDGANTTNTPAAGSGAKAAADCKEVKEPFRLGLEASSADGAFKASIVDALPSPPEKFENTWTVRFMTADGQPASDATLESVKGWMPAHGHDTKKPAVITKLDQPATYKVDTINLWMEGAWSVTFNLKVSGKSTEIVYWACIQAH